MNNTLLIICALLVHVVYGHYWRDRENLITKEYSQTIGANLKLSLKEILVNRKLLEIKFEEFDKGLANQSSFLPSLHFFYAKHDIEDSKVFRFIQQLPKGASLHSHTSAINSLEFVFQLTYRQNLYGCIVDNVLILNFFSSPDASCDWILLSVWRQLDRSFDRYLISQLALSAKDLESRPSIDKLWGRFQNLFKTVSGLINYRPVFEDYFRRTLEEFYEDNVMFFEFRGSLKDVYELDGTIYSEEETVYNVLNIIEDFKREHPDFLGARLIYARNRRGDEKKIKKYLQTYLRLKELFPEFVVGFDLVGQEDLGRPLLDFANQFLNISDHPFFFHAGETNWNGVSSDQNLIDAVLLGAKRIGHGYGILKHVEVLKIIKEKGIAIELNPISNQVLNLVYDLRDHTGAHLIAAGYPVVVSCDDPGLWGAKGLSYDWYMVFMGMTRRDGDLRILKQLAINSILYSSLDGSEKQAGLVAWQIKWNQFIDSVLIKIRSV